MIITELELFLFLLEKFKRFSDVAAKIWQVVTTLHVGRTCVQYVRPERSSSPFNKGEASPGGRNRCGSLGRTAFASAIELEQTVSCLGVVQKT